MPSHQAQPRFRQVHWQAFQLGGTEGRNVLSSTRKKPLEPITRLDLDVKAGLKSAKFDMAAFRSQVGYAQRDSEAMRQFEESHVYMGHGQWLLKPEEEES